MTSLVGGAAWGASFEEEYPNLQKYNFVAPDSNVYFGLGLAPISVMHQSPNLAVSLFQAHWINSWLDWELLNASVGFTYLNTNNSFALNDFTFRTCPKIRIGQTISVGFLVGMEFISFPSVTAITFKGGFATPDQPFSTSGLIYGGVISEVFSLGKGSKLRISQTAYTQTYSTLQTPDGWKYVFDNNALNTNQASIAPSMVYQIEFSFLY